MTDQAELNFLEPLRKNVGNLFNTSKDNILISSSASEILSQIPFILKISKKTKIILVSSDFPSITRPWLSFQKRNSDVTISFVNDQSNSSLTENIISEIDSQTAMVCLSNIQFSTGTKVNVKSLREATENVGALLVLDATQALGAIPIDLESIRPDVVVSSGYKWLGGHGGIGVGYFSNALLKEQPHATGWMSTQHPFDTAAMELNFSKSARKYTQSTMSYLTVKGLEVSTGELKNLDPIKIEKHAMSLSNYLLDALKGSKWTVLRERGSMERSPNILSLQNKEIDDNILTQELREKRIVCSFRNGRLRVSIAHYNSQEDLDTLLRLLL